MKQASGLEKISGSLPVNAGVTALAAVLAGPVAALIPVLTSTLASGRHKVRVEAAISEIDSRLSSIEKFNESLTDSQYQLINNIVVTILNTPNDEKIKYLKDAIYNTPLLETLDMHHATVLGRAFDNISVSELIFLIECHGQKILFNDHKTDGFYNIDKFTQDGECANGLISLGLLARSDAEGLMSDIGAYHFTPLAEKVLDMVSNKIT
ncbi:hypothetical protein [Colwellia sp. MB02u-14]|jgi:hypothetical protein|uniref:hypothetical protein n=1 Tax=Colwellia sp. MB02u-14 TaxID=2759815 RepID=UPI0015F3A802|nr:hypothetical protein [Colwellia sp. MB02u-14]MBA6303131.1 hypothetical protein [Colwellia sp. MB02u-14]